MSMNAKMDLSVVYQMHIVSTLLVATPVPVSQDILEMERSAIVINMKLYLIIHLSLIIYYFVYIQITMTDTNDCSAGTDSCGDQAFCIDTDGSFTCMCNTGYTSNGVP